MSVKRPCTLEMLFFVPLWTLASTWREYVVMTAVEMGDWRPACYNPAPHLLDKMLMAVKIYGRALAYRNYRLFLLGQGISLVGTWMQQVALGWLLYRLTASPLLLGLISFSSQIPTLFLSPLAGVAADRLNRHRTLIVTQILAMVQAVLLLLVAVYAQGSIVWPLIGLGFLLGIINAFDMPIRQSFVIDMVPDREHLGHAIALNSSIFNGARLIGPSIAGVIIATWGEAACFLLNAVSYVAVVLALLAMRDLPEHRPRPAGNVLRELKTGFGYAVGFAPLRSLLLMVTVISGLSMSMNALMPVFAKDVLKGDAGTQGFLMGAMGMGALGAALYLTARKSVLGLGRVLVAASALFGAGLIAFSYSTHIGISLGILVVTGCAAMLHMASTNTLIQTIVEEDKRGRIMSLYAMALMGIGPIGSLLCGILANWIGAPASIRVSGILCLLASGLFAMHLPHLRRLVRPIYEAAGILERQEAPGG